MKGFGIKKEKTSKPVKVDLMQISKHKLEAIELIKTGRSKKAERIYMQLLREGIEDKEIYLNLSKIYSSQGLIDKAIKKLKKAISISKSNSILWFSLGMLYKRKNDLNQAIEAYNKGLRIDPENTLALINLSNIYEENSDE